MSEPDKATPSSGAVASSKSSASTHKKSDKVSAEQAAISPAAERIANQTKNDIPRDDVQKHANLVVIPAGDNSLHALPGYEWYTTDDKQRNYDLCIIYYGSNPDKQKEYTNNSEFIIENKGPKWMLIREFLKLNYWKKYQYIWMPDDDLKIDGGAQTISKMFDIAKQYNLKIGQPALEDINIQSSYRHILRKRPGRIIHYTNFVEIMAPFFERSTLELISPAINVEFVKSGWGLDMLWSSWVNYQDIAVVDCTPVEHTRAQNAFSQPVHQSNGKPSFYEKYQIDPQRECYDLMKKFNIVEFKKGSFLEVFEDQETSNSIRRSTSRGRVRQQRNVRRRSRDGRYRQRGHDRRRDMQQDYGRRSNRGRSRPRY